MHGGSHRATGCEALPRLDERGISPRGVQESFGLISPARNHGDPKSVQKRLRRRGIYIIVRKCWNVFPALLQQPGRSGVRMRPAPVGGGFALPDYWIWCGSPIHGEDGRYHLFASRWPRSLSFTHWAVASEIVRASASRPEGPYQFEEVVLPPRDPAYFDGRVTHNPAIVRAGDTFLLFYTGATFDGPAPTPDDPAIQNGARWQQAWHNKRIGLATAKSVLGPWTRPDHPALDVRPGAWDSVITSNPAPCVCPDGRILLLYKSTPDRHDPRDGVFRGRFHLGGAMAERWDRPFQRISDAPLLRIDRPDAHVEDPFCWHDGRTTRPAKLERPQILFENGRPTHLFFATCDSESNLSQATRTWTMVIPLSSGP